MLDGLPYGQKRMYRAMKRVTPWVLVCLTYPASYPPVPKALEHLNRLLRMLKRAGNQGIWFLCHQARGAPFFWLLASRYIEKDALASSWYHIVGSHDPQHLKAGISISGFNFRTGSENFLLKRILPLADGLDFQYGVFGSLALKIQSWI
jgi:hypothetical protein